MHIMQYEITLPADYDMEIIRHRVATRGNKTDAFPGLGLKAYAVRERGLAGSTVNQYAPFYFWVDPTGLNEFLFGPGFGGLSDDFGRPDVRHWVGVAFEPGPALGAAPDAGTRRTIQVPAGSDLTGTVEAAIDDLRSDARAAGVHSAALAVDPLHWQLVQFTLWADAAPDPSELSYQVLHTSAPHLAELPRGRHW